MAGEKNKTSEGDKKYPLYDEISAVETAHKVLLDSAIALYPDNPSMIGALLHGVHAMTMNAELNALSEISERMAGKER